MSGSRPGPGHRYRRSGPFTSHWFNRKRVWSHSWKKRRCKPGAEQRLEHLWEGVRPFEAQVVDRRCRRLRRRLPVSS